MTGHTRWLLTLTIEAELSQLETELESLEVHFEDPHPVPLGEHEQVVGCWGPADLPVRLQVHPHPAVLAVHPDSPMELL